MTMATAAVAAERVDETLPILLMGALTTRSVDE